MGMYIVLVSLWIIWNIVPFGLMYWLWRDQLRYRRVILFTSAMLIIYSVIGYALFDDAVVSVPLLSYLIVFLLSFTMIVLNKNKKQTIDSTGPKGGVAHVISNPVHASRSGNLGRYVALSRS